MGITPRHCSADSQSLCNNVRYGQQPPRGVVPPTPVRSAHRTLEEGRQVPRREDARLLHTRTGLRRDVRPVGAVTSVAVGPLRQSRPLHRHPRRCGNMRRQDTATPVTVPPTTPRQQHPRVLTRVALYAATLKAAPGRAQDAP
jgi:hypothetical protein